MGEREADQRTIDRMFADIVASLVTDDRRMLALSEVFDEPGRRTRRRRAAVLAIAAVAVACVVDALAHR